MIGKHDNPGANDGKRRIRVFFFLKSVTPENLIIGGLIINKMTFKKIANSGLQI